MTKSSPPNKNTEDFPFFLDKEGHWFNEGVEITHVRTCLLFSKSLKKGRGGKYYIKVGRECAEVIIEDTPYIVKSVTVQAGPEGIANKYLLHLNDGTKESLEPQTLSFGKDNVMYCKVKNGSEKARFLRPAYYQICSQIEFDETEESYQLPWNGKKVPVNY